jgi:hypothetical protein
VVVPHVLRLRRHAHPARLGRRVGVGRQPHAAEPVEVDVGGRAAGVAPDAVRTDAQVGLVGVSRHEHLGAGVVDQLQFVAELQHPHLQAGNPGGDRQHPAVEVAARRAAADVRGGRPRERQGGEHPEQHDQ